MFVGLSEFPTDTYSVFQGCHVGPGACLPNEASQMQSFSAHQRSRPLFEMNKCSLQVTAQVKWCEMGS